MNKLLKTLIEHSHKDFLRQTNPTKEHQKHTSLQEDSLMPSLLAHTHHQPWEFKTIQLLICPSLNMHTSQKNQTIEHFLCLCWFVCTNYMEIFSSTVWNILTCNFPELQPISRVTARQSNLWMSSPWRNSRPVPWPKYLERILMWWLKQQKQ